MVPQLDLLPTDIKEDLEKLTMVEEMLISPILAVMSIYRLPGGALINRGFCANFSQDLGEILTTLPRLPKDLPLLVLKKKDQNNNVKQFIVNRHRVERVLKYLCKNNPAYVANNIQFSLEHIEQLPLNGIPNDLPTAEDTNCENVDELIVETGPYLRETEASSNNQSVDDQYEAFVESTNDEALQVDNIRTSINFPKASKKAINEFTQDSICSLIFPKLFPDGTGDPTTKGIIFMIIF
jgi:hypothetical protein